MGTGTTKKQLRTELQRRASLLEAKRKADIAEKHKKSGYTDYLVRLPGSFEGSKK